MPSGAKDATNDAPRRGDIPGPARAREALEERRAAASRAVKRATVRLAKRTQAIQGDLAKIADAQVVAEQARWLVAEAARAPRGARSLAVTDWSSGEARTVEVPLDPAKPARVQVDAMFQRARRLKLGAKVAEARLAEAETALAVLRPAATEIEQAETLEALDAAIARARAAAPREVKLEPPTKPGAKPPPLQARSLPYRTFRARSGARILVGRGASQNDELTFHVARPRDLWLHAKGLPGAHVIVTLQRDHTCPGDVLADAAHLAAHFSDARDEAVVDVSYSPRRYLRKPRGSPPGLVVVDREKVIAVRLQPDVLAALLASEET